MSKRAEERAWKIYPYETGMKGLICENSRGIYIQGYKQAEQDLALTAEDVSCIIHLADQFGKDYQKIANVFNKDREEEK